MNDSYDRQKNDKSINNSMTENFEIERKNFFWKFSQKVRNRMFDEKCIDLERIKKSNLTANKNLEEEAARIERDIQILREIRLDEQSSRWND
ncbi:MAG TPA: hypothetical protein VLH94_00350 [Spirochaetia bacterium]|nr:hypothetical protein [Spirochaetia bacterium]